MTTTGDTSRSAAVHFDNAVHRAFETEVTFAGTPEQVFPLLCPVREYDWIHNWSCVMVYSASGVAELGCVFRKNLDLGDEIWTVSRHQPGRAISFVRVVADIWVVLMELTLSPGAVGPTARENTTTVLVRHTYTALGPKGAAEIAAVDEEHHVESWRTLARMGSHYLVTGTMLTPQEH